jgi:thiamine transporter ThiT
MVTNSSQSVSNEKRAKNLILAIVAVLSAVIAFALHYFCNTNSRANEITLNYLVVLTFFVTLSANCAAGLIVGLFRHGGSGKYMLTAAVVSVLEVIPFPFCRIYFSMSTPSDFAGNFFRNLYIQAAVIVVVVLLLTAVINLLSKKYKIKVSVEKIQSSENSDSK